MNMTAIIACKNRTKNLKYCLASIDACTPRPNTVVVDFGSTDNLADIIHYPWLSIIRVDRGTKIFHKARALNIGIRAVKTKFMCITDADQIFAKNFFGVVHKRLVNNSRIFVMCHTYFLTKIPKGVTPDNIADNYPKLVKNLRGSKTHGDGCCNGVLTRWVKRVRGYDEQYIGYGAEDSDFASRAELSGFKRTWIHKATTMIHLPHPKAGKYYDQKVFKRNRKMFFKKQRTREKIVNKDKQWGKL